jgi:hypothetical protein
MVCRDWSLLLRLSFDREIQRHECEAYPRPAEDEQQHACMEDDAEQQKQSWQGESNEEDHWVIADPEGHDIQPLNTNIDINALTLLMSP